MQLFHTWLFLLFTFSIASSVHVTNEEFINKIQSQCYFQRTPFSQPIPLLISDQNAVRSRNEVFKDTLPSMTVETLIDLIEKIESQRHELDAYKLALALLRKFRTDDLAFSNGFFEISNDMKIQYKIESAVLNIDNRNIDVSMLDNTLDLADNCSMHYLLSHNIDIVAVNDLNSETFMVSRNKTNNDTIFGEKVVEFKPRFEAFNLPNGTKLTTKPREYGVGTFRQNSQHAIMLNKLLLGVVAGLSNPATVSVEQLFHRIKKDVNLTDVKMDVNSEVDPLLAVTISAVLSYGAYTDEQIYEKLFGATGYWNSLLCANEYNLNVIKEIADLKDIPGVAATMAEIRGAVDGYSIGQALREMMRIKPDMSASELKLSQILRLYYSPTGFEPETTEYGYCRRKQIIIDEDRIVHNAQALKRLSILLAKGAVTIDDSYVTAAIVKVKDEYIKNMRIAKDIAVDDKQWCIQYDKHTEKIEDAICETRSDLFVLLDHNQNEAKLELQFTILDALLKQMNIERHGDSITILTLSANQTNQNTLHRIVWKAINKGCAACKTVFTNFKNIKPLLNYESFPSLIDETMTEFENDFINETYVPSRTFLIMNFSPNYGRKGNINKLRQSIQEMKTRHHEVQFLVVGEQNIDENEEENFFSTETMNVKQISERILRRMCENAALFQYNKCDVKKSEEISYNGYVTPGKVQHFAIHSQFFNKSNELSFKITSKYGKLVICVGRSPNEHIVHKEGICHETNVLTITRKNPCPRGSQTCQPFYFSVYAMQPLVRNYVCRDESCLNMRQIPFTFTHTGLTCNNALSVVFKPLFLITSVLFSFLFKKQHF